MSTLVTGAAGFLGAGLLRKLLADETAGDIVAVDLAPQPFPDGSGRLRWVTGGIDDPACLAAVMATSFDMVFHLASIPGALAEREPALGRRVNLDSTLALFDRLAEAGTRPRVVFASSIAVYGEMAGDAVHALTPTRPTLTYGAHKRMAEIALADLTRRGGVSGIALRLPGLVARPGGATALGSAFMSDLMRSVAAGQPYVCPVGPEATCWWMSAACAVANLRHAAAIVATGDIQLPALHLSIGEVVAALAETFGPACGGLVTHRPSPEIERLFGRLPPLLAQEAEALGFAHDGSALRLVAAALAAD